MQLPPFQWKYCHGNNDYSKLVNHFYGLNKRVGKTFALLKKKGENGAKRISLSPLESHGLWEKNICFKLVCAVYYNICSVSSSRDIGLCIILSCRDLVCRHEIF